MKKQNESTKVITTNILLQSTMYIGLQLQTAGQSKLLMSKELC